MTGKKKKKVLLFLFVITCKYKEKGIAIYLAELLNQFHLNINCLVVV